MLMFLVHILSVIIFMINGNYGATVTPSSVNETETIFTELSLPSFCAKWCHKSLFTTTIIDNTNRYCIHLQRGYSRRDEQIIDDLQIVRVKNLRNAPIPLFAAKANTGFNIEKAYHGMSDKIYMPEWSDYRYNYKSPLMDYWFTMKFDRINFSLYKQGNLHCSIQFNAKGSNNVNWFHNSKIIHSQPWNVDALKKLSWLYFSIDGDNSNNRAFTSVVNYGGCPNDFGLFMVLENSLDGCKNEFFFDPSIPASRIIWTYDPTSGGPGYFENKQQAQEADELRIEGFIDRDVFIYE